MPLLSSVSW